MARKGTQKIQCSVIWLIWPIPWNFFIPHFFTFGIHWVGGWVGFAVIVKSPKTHLFGGPFPIKLISLMQLDWKAWETWSGIHLTGAFLSSAPSPHSSKKRKNKNKPLVLLSSQQFLKRLLPLHREREKESINSAGLDRTVWSKKYVRNQCLRTEWHIKNIWESNVWETNV